MKSLQRSVHCRTKAAHLIPCRAQLKAVVNVIAAFLAALFNRSLSSGSVPEAFKAAYITPLLKKWDMDPADVRSYRPISNLSVVCKLQCWSDL